MVQKLFCGQLSVVEQLSFHMISSIITFYLYLILGSSLTFWGPIAVRVWFQTVLWSTHVGQQVLFSLVP